MASQLPRRCLLPFSVNASLQENYRLGVGILCAVLVLGIDAFAIYLKKFHPSPDLLLVPIVAGTAISLRPGFFRRAVGLSHGGALHFLPVAAHGQCRQHFAASDRQRAGLSLYRPRVHIRFFATLTLTIIFANIVLSIIVDLHRRLLDQAIVDPLTGVFNRRYMERSLSDAIERLRRNSARPPFC